MLELADRKTRHALTVLYGSVAFVSLFAMLVTGIFILSLPLASDADAQGVRRSLLRVQTRNVQRAVSEQVRRAIKPKLMIKRGATGAVLSMAMSADNSLVLTVVGTGTARIWDMQNGAELRKLAIEGVKFNSGQITSDDEDAILTADDGTIRIFGIETGELKTTLNGHTGPVRSVAVSPDGTRIISGGDDTTVRVWDRKTGQQIAVLQGHDGGVSSVAIAPDNLTVASGSKDTSVRLWDLESAKTLRVFGEHNAAVTGVAFGADGKTVVSGSEDRVMHAWDVSNARANFTFRGSEGAVLSLEVSKEGNFVVSGGDDNVIRVWDMKNGEMVKEIQGHEGAVRALSFDLGNKRILSASEDGTTRVWDVQSGALFAQMISTVAGWVVVDEDGRFDGTEDGVKDVAWNAEKDILDLDFFSKQYHEPGLLAKHMADEKAFIHEGRESVPDGIFLPPEVTITNQTQPDGNGTIQLTVEAVDQGGRIEDIRLFHNDKLVHPDAITDTQSEIENDFETRTVTFSVRLVSGENTFDAFGIGERGIEGEPAETSITYDGGPTEPPTLHVLVVGINDYVADELKLNYGTPDALAIALALSETTGQVFKNVVGYQLLDQFATRQGILDALELMKSLPKEDVLMIYMAGHGITVFNEWYFLPREYDSPFFDDDLTQEIGISAKDIQGVLSQVGAHKIIMALDACYSGAAVRNLRNFAERKVLRDIGREVGVHVLAATRADQVAYEFPVLKQGLLTYTILKGLEGEADRGKTDDGFVTASEMISYAKEVLPVMARKDYPTISQQPVAYSRGSDFRIRGN